MHRPIHPDNHPSIRPFIHHPGILLIIQHTGTVTGGSLHKLGRIFALRGHLRSSGNEMKEVLFSVEDLHGTL